MIQRFIELGEGYSDLYELVDIANRSRDRIHHFFAFHTGDQTSVALALKPTETGDFQPIYICREGIPNPHHKPNGRYALFQKTAESLGKTVIEADIKPSGAFAEKELYYQYITGILRMNHFLAPLQ